jgi:hypothetical protein
VVGADRKLVSKASKHLPNIGVTNSVVSLETPTPAAPSISLGQISQPMRSPDLALPFFPPPSPPPLFIPSPPTQQVAPAGVMTRQGQSKVVAGEWLWENFDAMNIQSEEVCIPCTGSFKTR